MLHHYCPELDDLSEPSLHLTVKTSASLLLAPHLPRYLPPRQSEPSPCIPGRGMPFKPGRLVGRSSRAYPKISVYLGLK